MKTPARVEIPSFPGGKRIALTTSFDDGVTHDRKVVRAFNAMGIKGTFNLNSGSLGREGTPAPDGPRVKLDASEVAELYAGHEVAIHTVTHPHLTKLDAAQIAREVLEDRIALEDIVGYPVRGMAYPFGSYNADVIAVLRQLGIVYCRTVNNGVTSFPPAEPLAWATTAHQYEPVAEIFEKHHGNPKFSGVIYIWGHTYEFADRDDWTGVERIFQPLAGKPDVWYCTNIELFDYEEARKRLQVAANRASVFNPSSCAVTLNVDGKLIDVPPGKLLSLTQI